MTDNVPRLRAWEPEGASDLNLCDDAADEINRLRQQLYELAGLTTELKEQNAELLAILNKIADLKLTTSSAASIAQSALDTMRVLQK